MKFSKFTKTSLSVFLSLLMILTALSPAALAVTFDRNKLGNDTYLTSKTDYTVAPGITESQITTNNSAGNNQVQGYALEVDLSNPTTSVIASYKNYDATSWGMQKVRDQAYAAEKKLGVNVVGGVNGDFFNMQTGAPTGTFVMNGVQYVKNDSWNYFAIKKDGTPIIGSGYLDTSDIKECVGGPAVLIKDGQLTSDAINSGYGVSPMPRTAVGIKADGSVVFFVADGRQAPKSCGQTFYELANSMAALGCVDALCLDGGGSATLISQHEGSDELVCRNSPSDGVERTVSSSILICSTAKPTGEFHHATITPNNEVYTPGSSVQFTAAGVDSAGSAAELPADGTFALADASFGTIDSNGLFVSNGKTGTVTVNYISGGAVCGSVSIEVAVPDELYVASSEVSLGFEETTDFGIVAKYKDRTVNMKAGDIAWSIVNENGEDISGKAGTFDGLTFTTFDGVTVNAVVTATLTADASVSAEIKAIIGAMPVVLYDFEYTTDKAEADANENLKWIPDYTMPTWTRNIGTTHQQQAAEFYEQGYPFYNWPNGAIPDATYKDSVETKIVSKADGEPVRFGDHAMKVTFDFSTYNKSSNANFYIRTTVPTYTFEGSPTALGAWIYVPEGAGNLILYLQCANKNNSTVYQIVGKTVDWTGWKYVELDLTGATAGSNNTPDNAPFGTYQGNGVFWISYQPALNGTDLTSSYVYIDNIQLVYGANTDDITNPVINSIRTDDTDIVDGETVLTSNTNTFRASYADVQEKYMTGINYDEVKMLIDGVDVTGKCYINEGDEEIYFYDAELANGSHSIEVIAADKFGNSVSDLRYFTVKGESAETAVALNAEGTPVLGKDYVMSVVADNAADIAAVDVEIKILSRFTYYWNNFRVEAAPNYTIVGEPTYDSTNAVIGFKAVRSENADAALDDGTVAKIIYSIPTNVPEGLEVTYRVAKGEITYTADKNEKIVNGFSGKIITTCNAPFSIAADTMLVGTNGGNITVTDTDGKTVEGVNVYTDGGELIGVTDANGKVFTDKFVAGIGTYSIYAEKDGLLSFVFTGQSFPSGGNEDGTPSYVKLNASANSETMQSISWMSSPIASADKAVVLYAEKAAYDKDGDAAFKTFEGESIVSEMASSATIETNYAVRLNKALIKGLTPDTEYVYKVGDGEKMSELKRFTTSRNGTAVNFFVIGDTQATDTTNTDKITEILASSGVKYDFGIQTGDAVDNGGNYTMWANIAKVFGGEFLSEQDLIQVLGNHEFYGDEDASNAAAYFNLPETKEDGAAPDCYSVQYGNVYIAVINYVGLSGYKRAAEWIEKDAANTNATWKVLAVHQPAYFTNPGGNTVETQKVLSDLADAADIDFVFSGHDHSYARTLPVTAGEVDNENGAVYYICGSTGEKSYPIVPNDAHHFDCLVEDYNAIFLTVKVTDTSFDIETHEYTADGQDVMIDSYSKTKEVTCTPDGHDYIYSDGRLTCSVCNYSINAADDGYTGFATDKATNGTMYFLGGEAKTGWFSLGDDNYLFDDNGVARTGKITIDEHTYIFGKDGKMTKGSLEKQSNGKFKYYINGKSQRGWYNIDGYWYYFDRRSGNYSAKGKVTLDGGMVFTFDDNSRLITGCLLKNEFGTAYYWGPEPVTGLYEIEGYTYYFGDDTYMIVNDSVEVNGKIYSFNGDGKFAHYGAHKDSNGDGRCEKCTTLSPFWSFIQMLLSMIRKIQNYFRSLFTFK